MPANFSCSPKIGPPLLGGPFFLLRAQSPPRPMSIFQASLSHLQQSEAKTRLSRERLYAAHFSFSSSRLCCFLSSDFSCNTLFSQKPPRIKPIIPTNRPTSSFRIVMIVIGSYPLFFAEHCSAEPIGSSLFCSTLPVRRRK